MAIKDKGHLKTQSNQIYNETVKGANTANRIGGMHGDTIDTMFAIRKPSIFFAGSNLVIDCGQNDLSEGDVFLQVVHWNKHKKIWQAASGVGVKLIDYGGSSDPNTSQAVVGGINSIRCKRQLTINATAFNIDNGTDVAELYSYLFTPYYNLRFYSFKKFLNDNVGLIDLYYNAQRGTSYVKTSYHKYGLKKTGLAVTKAVANEFGTKSVILSDVLPFIMHTNSSRDVLYVSFANKKKIDASV